MQIDRLASDQDFYLREMRRKLHAHPELSWSENETTEMIAKELEGAGWAVNRFSAHTGLIATLSGNAETKAKAKALVLRADIDALPVVEKTGLPFESQNPGIMHACGHDAHAAMLLGAAHILKQVQDQWAGKLSLLFQPAEEINEGAKYCISQGALEGADAIFGMHIWGDLPSPLINVQAGPRMAGCDQFFIVVHGVSAHGGMPHQGVDAIVTAAAIVGNIQALVSRNNDPREPLVITIGKIQGGQRYNIVADTVDMVGTVRTLHGEVRTGIEEKLRRTVMQTAAAYGATAELSYEYMAQPLINKSAQLVGLAKNAAVRLYGADVLREMPPVMASEDFAYYQEHVPSVFAFLGATNPSLGITALNHNDHFTVDEAALQRGTALYVQFAVDFLHAEIESTEGLFSIEQ